MSGALASGVVQPHRTAKHRQIHQHHPSLAQRPQPSPHSLNTAASTRDGNGAYQFNIPSTGDYAVYCGELLFHLDDGYSALHYDGDKLYAFHKSFVLYSYEPLGTTQCTFDENQRNRENWPRNPVWDWPLNPKER